MLTNGTGVFAQSVAHYVLALLHAHASGLWETRDAQRAHRWAPRQIKTLERDTLLVVGLGAIGCAIAELAAATGVIVHAVRRTPSECNAPVHRIFLTAELHTALEAP